MERLDNETLYDVVGGGTFTGTMINAITSLGKFVYGLGQSLGSGIRRIGTNNLCPLR